MPRGFKRDHYETEKAYREGRFKDKRKRSFIGRAPDRTTHELLDGEDKSNRYREVMEASRGLCQGCGKPHYVGSLGEWDHIQGGLSGRCDCLHNSQWVCVAFHRKKHVHLIWKGNDE